MKWANQFKRQIFLLLFCLLVLVLTSCNSSSSMPSVAPENSTTTEIPKAPEENNMVEIQIAVGETLFSAKLYNNQATKALLTQMPLTITMDELNGNEKFYYLPNNLPTDPYEPGEINAGDLLLYGSDCLVLFYEDFSSSYHYTKLGYIEDTTGLANALGSGKAQISFVSE